MAVVESVKMKSKLMELLSANRDENGKIKWKWKWFSNKKTRFSWLFMAFWEWLMDFSHDILLS